MATRKRQFAQMELPFDKAELRKPVRFTVAGAENLSGQQPAASSQQPYLPPGLRELQHADALTDDEVRQLQEVAYTARGKKPATVDEWRDFRAVVIRVLGEIEADHEE